MTQKEDDDRLAVRIFYRVESRAYELALCKGDIDLRNVGIGPHQSRTQPGIRDGASCSMGYYMPTSIASYLFV